MTREVDGVGVGVVVFCSYTVEIPHLDPFFFFYNSLSSCTVPLIYCIMSVLYGTNMKVTFYSWNVCVLLLMLMTFCFWMVLFSFFFSFPLCLQLYRWSWVVVVFFFFSFSFFDSLWKTKSGGKFLLGEVYKIILAFFQFCILFLTLAFNMVWNLWLEYVYLLFTFFLYYVTPMTNFAGGGGGGVKNYCFLDNIFRTA